MLGSTDDWETETVEVTLTVMLRLPETEMLCETTTDGAELDEGAAVMLALPEADALADEEADDCELAGALLDGLWAATRAAATSCGETDSGSEQAIERAGEGGGRVDALRVRPRVRCAWLCPDKRECRWRARAKHQRGGD